MHPANRGPRATDEPTETFDLDGFIALRWGALLVWAATVGVASGVFDVPVPVAPMLTLVSVGALSNAAAAFAARRPDPNRPRIAAAVLLLDTLLLTGLLAVSGGASNPFTAAYLYPVVMGALLLPTGPAWLLTTAATAGYASLFLVGPGDPSHGGHAGHAGHTSGMGGHMLGMGVAFVLVAPFLTFAIGRIRRALTDAAERLRGAEKARARDARLASLATLATGAAHELSTPLATIAVATAELEQHVGDADTPIAADVALIRSQVDRCRFILGQMAADAGVGLWEGARPSTPGDLLGLALERVDGAADIELLGPDALYDHPILVPERAVARALRGLLRNACQASGGGAGVRVHAERAGDALRLAIEDDGPGMSAAVQARVGEPFFTTRETGRGMGLGVFYARTVADQLGGRLSFDSAPGRGTTVHVHLPLFREARP
jgi:two-component system, sensor histidine kinase RegB